MEKNASRAFGTAATFTVDVSIKILLQGAGKKKMLRAHGGVYVRGPQERARWPGCRNMALGGESPSMSGNRSSFYGSCVQE